MTGDGTEGTPPPPKDGVKWGDEMQCANLEDDTEAMMDEDKEGEVRFAMSGLQSRSMSLPPEPFMIMRSKVRLS